MHSSHLLDVKNLSMRFGGLLAVDGVNLELDKKQILGALTDALDQARRL